MRKQLQILTIFPAVAFLGAPASGASKESNKKRREQGEITGAGPAVLWKEPTDIAQRNLYYGPGGEKHQPHPPFTFDSEDMGGTNPKFVVRDRDGVKWKVKL